MEIGVPKETKDQEFRVGLSPSSVRVVGENEHTIFVETGAGAAAGFTDHDYRQAGAQIVSQPEYAWNRELVVKVKEPLLPEYKFLQKEQLLFTYLHLAADRKLTEHLIDCGVTAIAYETVEQLGSNKLPLLTILVSCDLVKKMRPGSVIVDVAVDQGGCIETLHPTSHTHPIYIEEGVVHYGVPNMPGSVPRTATQALNNSTLPYVLKLANFGMKALEIESALVKGVNVQNHHLVHPAIQQVFPDLAVKSIAHKPLRIFGEV